MNNKVYVLECYDRFPNMSYVLGVFQKLPKVDSIQRLISHTYGNKYKIDDNIMECLYDDGEYHFCGMALYLQQYNVE